MTLATTVSVPVLRGPAATAKILAAIDLLSGGRLMVGLGPGSSARDYELIGVLPIGSPEECAEKLLPCARAGAHRVFLWPITDERAQLEVFRERVVPLLKVPAERPVSDADR